LSFYLELEKTERREGRGKAGDGRVHGRPIAVKPGRELERIKRERSRGLHEDHLWLKMLYHSPERDRDRWWQDLRWVSDAHNLRPDGSPTRRPSYKVGDLMVLYLVGHMCPSIAEVTAESVFDPERVAREGSSVADSERWGWLTEVRVIHHAGLDRAPALEAIGVKSTSVRQHGHIHLTRAQFQAALRAIEKP
jgi:hypothetical protein